MSRKEVFGPLIFLLEKSAQRRRQNPNEARRQLANIEVFGGMKRVDAQNLEIQGNFREAAVLYEKIEDHASAKRCLQKAEL